MGAVEVAEGGGGRVKESQSFRVFMVVVSLSSAGLIAVGKEIGWLEAAMGACLVVGWLAAFRFLPGQRRVPQ